MCRRINAKLEVNTSSWKNAALEYGRDLLQMKVLACCDILRIAARKIGVTDMTYYRWPREGLKVPQKQPKRGRLWLTDGSCIRLRPQYKDHVWSYGLYHHYVI